MVATARSHVLCEQPVVHAWDGLTAIVRYYRVGAYTQRVKQLAKAEYSPQSKLWPGVYSICLSECFVRILTAVSWSLESVLHHGSIEGYSSCFDGPDRLSL